MKKIFKIKNNKLNKIYFYSFIILVISFSVKIASAEVTANFKDLANNITNNIISTVATMLMSIAFLLFFYGVIVFIYGRFNDKGSLSDIKKGKDFMLWGMIALFVMVSAWGIIKFAQGLLFDSSSSNIQITPITFDTGALKTTTATNTRTAPSLASQNVKTIGQSCTVLAGATASECQIGLLCLGPNLSRLSTGQQGTCQKTVPDVGGNPQDINVPDVGGNPNNTNVPDVGGNPQ